VRRQAVDPISVRNGTIVADKENKVVLYVQGSPNLTIDGKSMLLSEPNTVTVDEKKDVMQTLSVVYSKPQKV